MQENICTNRYSLNEVTNRADEVTKHAVEVMNRAGNFPARFVTSLNEVTNRAGIRLHDMLPPDLR